MNKVIISGNLTKDMEVNVTKKDVLVGKFTVAVQIGYGDNSKTQFYPVVLFAWSSVLPIIYFIISFISSGEAPIA